MRINNKRRGGAPHTYYGQRQEADEGRPMPRRGLPLLNIFDSFIISPDAVSPRERYKRAAILLSDAENDPSQRDVVKGINCEYSDGFQLLFSILRVGILRVHPFMSVADSGPDGPHSP